MVSIDGRGRGPVKVTILDDDLDTLRTLRCLSANKGDRKAHFVDPTRPLHPGRNDKQPSWDETRI
jgi:hypothetical protein